MSPKEEYREVYSTEKGSICPDCGKPVSGCVCADRKKRAVTGDGKIRVRRETKGRGGKTVTTISGIAANELTLSSLLSDLKRLCGGGGTLKDGVIEIQGDHCDKILEALAKRGYQGKRAGG